MAKQTDIALRGMLMYSVFVRNHTKEGTFRALEADLDRIAALGTDIIWLMPIHPIGETARKGTLGSPYAIRDYRGINPEYGTMEDFQHLVEEIHRRGMKCIIDVVYNHTSPDSVLAAEHPEYFFRDSEGRPSRHVEEWWDVVDLDYSNRELWQYQIDTLVQWAQIVDGFRCDVASMVPVEFWVQARQQVEQVRPGCIWLAESVFAEHIRAMRRMCEYCASDAELYEAFDMTYPYDVWTTFDGCFSGESTLEDYARLLHYQDAAYQTNYVKLRCTENHDQPRFASRISNEREMQNWFAFSYFERGTTMLYSGTEFAPKKQISLFEKEDCFADAQKDWQPYLQQLRGMKRKLPVDGDYRVSCSGTLLLGAYDTPQKSIRAVFSMKGESGTVAVDLPDGSYTDLVDGREVVVEGGTLVCDGRPVIIERSAAV